MDNAAGSDDGWMDIEVPSNWQLELLDRLALAGAADLTAEGNRDVPVYTNIKYPFDPVHFPPPLARTHAR
jgi:hypothetical protein